ncbi:MAG: hypothetical protein LBT14_03340 [Treponema sp.]|jgi:hypothetical protein|nr:hypothetical protein [Treponema sp.]
MRKKTIKISCQGAGLIDWRSIKSLQEQYKDRTDEDIQKIMLSIIKYGWAFPAYVSKIDDDIWAIDAHGRLLAAEHLEKDGWIIPPIPVDWIQAKTKEEAKQLLLRCDSRYGTINREGFVEFIKDIDVVMEDLSLDVVIVDDDERAVEPKKINLSPYNKIHVLLSFQPGKFEDIQEHLEILKNTEGIEYAQSAN